MEQLRQEKLQIDQELRSYHGPGAVGTLHFPSRRTDRPYADLDGMGHRGRGGRGSGRGGPSRGTGGRGRGGYGKKIDLLCNYHLRLILRFRGLSEFDM